jgi:hypothetical protein
MGEGGGALTGLGERLTGAARTEQPQGRSDASTDRRSAGSGNCPGAEAATPLPHVIRDPWRWPITRLCTPSSPIDMLTSGIESERPATAVASSRAATSASERCHPREDRHHLVHRRRASEIVRREQQRHARFLAGRTQHRQRRRVAGRLEVHEVGMACPHQVREPLRSLHIVEATIHATLAGRAQRDQQRHRRPAAAYPALPHRLGQDLAQGDRRGRERNGIGGGPEMVDSPLEEVRSLPEEDRRLRAQRGLRVTDQGGAKGWRIARRDLPSPERYRLAHGAGGPCRAGAAQGAQPR